MPWQERLPSKGKFVKFGLEGTATSAGGNDSPAAPRRIVSVDPDDLLSSRCLKLLVDAGYPCEVERIDSKVKLLGSLRRMRPDIMWVISRCGLELARVIDLLREQDLDVPLIVLALRNNRRTAADALRRGAADFIPQRELARLEHVMERELRAADARRRMLRSQPEVAHGAADCPTRDATAPALLETIPHPVWILDAAGEHVRGNRHFEDFAALPAAALAGDTGDRGASATGTVGEVLLQQARCVQKDGGARRDMIRKVIDGEHGSRALRIMQRLLHGVAGELLGLVGAAIDVGARRKRKQEVDLLEAATRLSDATDSSPVSFYYVDAERRLQIWNRKVLELFPMFQPFLRKGMLMEDFLRQAAPSYLGPDIDLEAYVKWRMEHLTNPPQESFEYKTAHGHIVIVQDRKTPRGGTVITTIDVTDLRRKELALAASEANFQNVLRHTADGVYIADRRGRLLQVNPQMCALTGYDEAELRSMSVVELIESDAQRPDIRSLRQVIKGQPTLLVRPLRRKDGSRIVVEAHVMLQPNGNFLSIVRDITARSRDEQALKDSQRLLQAIFDTIPFNLSVKDRERRYLVANRTFAEFHGSVPEDITGRTLEDLAMRTDSDLNRVAKQDRAILSGQAERVDEIHPFQHAGGSQRTMHTIKTPLRDDEGRIVALLAISMDVTEAEAAREALQSERELLKTVFATLPHEVYVKDRQGRYLMFNNASQYFRQCGGDVVGLKFGDLAQRSPEELDEIATMDRDVLGGGAPVIDRVHTVTMPDGRGHTLHTVKSPLRGKDGEVIGLVGVSEDITELYAAKSEVMATHAMLGDAIQQLWAGFLLFDKHERLQLWNDWIADMFPPLLGKLRKGMTFEEVARLGVEAVDLPESSIEAYIQQRLREFRDPCETSLEQRLKDGRWMLLRDRRTSDGGTVSLRHEITELKHTEEALRVSEQRFRLLTENAPDLIFSYRLQPESGFDYVSPVAEHLCGYSPAEHYADPALWMRIVHPEDARKQESVFQAGGLSGSGLISLRWQHRNGKWIWLEQRCTPVVDDQDRVVGVSGIVRDVSERKLLEGQLQQAQRMEAVGQLAGGVAHDFNNMLMVISSCSDLILKELSPDHAAVKDVKLTQFAVHRSAELTRQLLAFSRKQILHLENLELHELISRLGKFLGNVVGEDILLETNLTLEFDTVYGDPGQIEQIILNLAINARHAMPQGGTLTFETHYLPAGSEEVTSAPGLAPGPYLMLTISDTGVGMTQEVLSHIFEPFFTTKEVGKGTGLGLSMVYGAVRQMGGDVQVVSEPGMGSTFKVILPCGRQEHREDQAAPVIHGNLGGSETILLVEDEELVRNTIRRILEGQGYTVVSAENGQTAGEIFRNLGASVDLLLTDLVMPVCGGPELARRIRAQRSDMKVLYMSGHTESSDIQAIETGAAAPILRKPFNKHTLLLSVRRALVPHGK